MRRLVLAAFFALFPLTDAVAKVLGQWQCSASYQGMPLQGTYTLEFSSHTQLYRHRGRMYANDGRFWDFEVETASMGGVGGIWANNMWHRAAHMKFQAYQGGYTIIADRERLDARCQM